MTKRIISSCIILNILNLIRLILSMIPLDSSNLLIEFRELFVYLVCTFTLTATLITLYFSSKVSPPQFLKENQVKLINFIQHPITYSISIGFCISLFLIGFGVFAKVPLSLYEGTSNHSNWQWIILIQQLILGISGLLIFILVMICDQVTAMAKSSMQDFLQNQQKLQETQQTSTKASVNVKTGSPVDTKSMQKEFEKLKLQSTVNQKLELVVFLSFVCKNIFMGFAIFNILHCALMKMMLLNQEAAILFWVTWVIYLFNIGCICSFSNMFFNYHDLCIFISSFFCNQIYQKHGVRR